MVIVLSILLTNCIAYCINCGITTLLMDTPYNKQVKDITRVHTWKEIYEYITNYKKEI